MSISANSDIDTNKQEGKHENLFQDIGQIVDGDDAKPTEIESYCVNCGENVFVFFNFDIVSVLLFFFFLGLIYIPYRELQNYY